MLKRTSTPFTVQLLALHTIMYRSGPLCNTWIVSKWSKRCSGVVRAGQPGLKSRVIGQAVERRQPIRLLRGINHVKQVNSNFMFRVWSVMHNSVVHFCQSVCKVRCVCQTSSLLDVKRQNFYTTRTCH